jgi:dihydropyrimidinase
LDPEKNVRLTADNLHSRLDHSIYENYTCQGYPVITISNGEVIQEDGRFKGRKGRGRFLRGKPFPNKRLRL